MPPSDPPKIPVPKGKKKVMRRRDGVCGFVRKNGEPNQNETFDVVRTVIGESVRQSVATRGGKVRPDPDERSHVEQTDLESVDRRLVGIDGIAFLLGSIDHHLGIDEVVSVGGNIDHRGIVFSTLNDPNHVTDIVALGLFDAVSGSRYRTLRRRQ